MWNAIFKRDSKAHTLRWKRVNSASSASSGWSRQWAHEGGAILRVPWKYPLKHPWPDIALVKQNYISLYVRPTHFSSHSSTDRWTTTPSGPATGAWSLNESLSSCPFTRRTPCTGGTLYRQEVRGRQWGQHSGNMYRTWRRHGPEGGPPLDPKQGLDVPGRVLKDTRLDRGTVQEDRMYDADQDTMSRLLRFPSIRPERRKGIHDFLTRWAALTCRMCALKIRRLSMIRPR